VSGVRLGACLLGGGVRRLRIGHVQVIPKSLSLSASRLHIALDCHSPLVSLSLGQRFAEATLLSCLEATELGRICGVGSLEIVEILLRLTCRRTGEVAFSLRVHLRHDPVIDLRGLVEVLSGWVLGQVGRGRRTLFGFGGRLRLWQVRRRTIGTGRRLASAFVPPLGHGDGAGNDGRANDRDETR
jgi:hypothetical protein